MDHSVVVAIGTAAGALVAAFGALIVSVLNGRREDRRHSQELVFRMAVENWQHDNESAKAMQEPSFVYPLGVYVVYMMMLWKLAGRSDLTPEVIRERLEQIAQLTISARQEIDRQQGRE